MTGVQTCALPIYFFKSLNTSSNIYSLTATQWVTRKLNVTFDYYVLGDSYSAPFGANRVLQFAGPNKADVVVNYKLSISDHRAVDLYTKIENLGNVRYSDNGFLAPGAWAIAGLKFNF